MDITQTKIEYEKEELAYIRGRVHKEMHKQLGVKEDGYIFSPAYKMGHWDGVIDFFDPETDKFPTGLINQAEEILGDLQGSLAQKGYEFTYEIEDNRPDAFLSVEDIPENIRLADGELELRDYQKEAIQSIVRQQIGIINHATGSGKTLSASGLIKTILPYLEDDERIAFFTHSTSIFEQSAKSIEDQVGIKVGRYGAGKKDFQKVTAVMIPTVNNAISSDPEAKLKLSAKERQVKRIAKEVAPKILVGYNQKNFLYRFLQRMKVKTKVDQKLKDTLEDIFYSCGTDKEVKLKLKGYEAEWQKLLEKKNGKILKKNKEAQDFLDSVAVMIVDEAHHTSSDTWYKTLLSCHNAQYRMALTGSIDKSNQVLWQRMQALFGGVTAQVTNDEMIRRGISAKPTITVFPILAPEGITEDDYMSAYTSGIVENEYRNLLIAKLTKKCYDRGEGVLVSISRIEQGEIISKFLKELGVPHDFIHGSSEKDLREQKIQEMRDETLKVLISSTILDEGVDISGIDSLVLGAGGKSLRQTLQRVGRGLRKKKGRENKLSVYDFMDYSNKHLKKHSEERIHIYEEEGFEVKQIPLPK